MDIRLWQGLTDWSITNAYLGSSAISAPDSGAEHRQLFNTGFTLPVVAFSAYTPGHVDAIARCAATPVDQALVVRGAARHDERRVGGAPVQRRRLMVQVNHVLRRGMRSQSREEDQVEVRLVVGALLRHVVHREVVFDCWVGAHNR